MAVLAGIKGPIFGRQFRLAGEHALIGRHPDCDFVLAFPHVSRRHAQILVEEGEYFVENLDRRQRTFVNGRLVSGRCPLSDKDQLRICDLLFTFYRSDVPHGKEVFAEPDLEVLSTVEMAPREPAPLPSGEDVVERKPQAQGKPQDRNQPGPEGKLEAKSRLEVMVRIGRHVGNALRLDDALPKVLDCLFLIFPAADRAFVMLREPNDDSLALKALRRRVAAVPDSAAPDSAAVARDRDSHAPDRAADAPDSIPMSLSLIDRVIAKREAVLSAERRDRASGPQCKDDGGSLMCVPLLDTQGRCMGVVQVDAVEGRFEPADLELLAGVAWQIALAIENARLHEKLLEQQELEFDLQVTREVRHKLLPQARPSVAGYSFFDFYESGAQVGGDFYDYHQLPGDRLAVIMADFWGKGVAAALCMAKLIGDVRYELSRDEQPAQAMARINARLCQHDWDDRYITLVLAVLDPVRHSLAVSSAGHLPPLHRTACGNVKLLGADDVGFPLGIDAANEYRETRVELEPGDAVVFYSDGIREAADDNDTVYGLDRLRGLLLPPPCNSGERGNAGEGGNAGDGHAAEFNHAAELGQRIASDVRQFVGPHPHRDDMCLICFGRTV